VIVNAADEQNFREFVSARSPALMRLAFLLTSGDQQAAEDLLQTALARIAVRWRHIDAPENYARQVMYRQQISWWRRMREFAVAYTPDQPGADETHSVELKIMVRKLLATLTARQRAVLVLRYFEDLPEGEVAHMLGCSVGTVRSTTHRALARLRQTSPDLGDLRAGSLDWKEASA
jgi:RNA polymerase sigma-70 factor (sigma-E family)